MTNSSKSQQKKFEQKANHGKCTIPTLSFFDIANCDRVQREIKEKEKAIETLSKRYGKRPPRGEKLPATIMGEEEVKQVLYAVGDNHGTLSPLSIVFMVAYLRLNCEPVQRMRDMLHQYFSASAVEKDFSLAISTGRAGARLTHNHARQFQFGSPPLSHRFAPFFLVANGVVDQSLTLWSIIMHD